MSKLPPDYINFIAKGIVHNLRPEGIPVKDEYTEDDLMIIFNCKSSEDLEKKIEEIEVNTVQALGLPVQESYTIQELAQYLGMEEEMLENMKGVFDSYPQIP